MKNNKIIIKKNKNRKINIKKIDKNADLKRYINKKILDSELRLGATLINTLEKVTRILESITQNYNEIDAKVLAMGIDFSDDLSDITHAIGVLSSIYKKNENEDLIEKNEADK